MKALIPAALALSLLPCRADWPTYLGPTRDAVSPDSIANRDWDSKPLATLWKAEVGRGCSSFAIAGGKAYTLGNSRDEDTLWCFDLMSGKVLWKHSYPERLDPKYYSGGPGATPTVDGNLVYSVSKSGKLFAVNTGSGEVVWSKDFRRDFGANQPTWGWSGAPLIVGSALLIDAGGKGAAVVALDKSNGNVIWKSGNDEMPGYASLVRSTLGGSDTILAFHGKALCGYDTKSGKLLFRQEWKTDYDVNASNPVPWKDGVFVSSGYGTGAGFIKVSGGQTSVAWTDNKLPLQFQNAVAHGDHVFACFGDARQRAEFRCVSLADGSTVWSERFAGNRGSVLKVGKDLLLLTENGELVLAELSTTGFNQVTRQQVLAKTIWGAPALSQGVLLARNNDGETVCLDLR
jgi:hypothetical protein